MTPRVSDTEVKRIINTSLNTTPFINTANVLIDKHLGSSSLSDNLMREIELWMSAHFTAIRQQQAKQESIGKTSITYQGKTEMGLKATLYGQQALALDPTGLLDQIGRKVAKFETIQSPTSDVTTATLDE